MFYNASTIWFSISYEMVSSAVSEYGTAYSYQSREYVHDLNRDLGVRNL